MTNVPIDKNNLTNFQRIFRTEKDITHHVTQTTNENSLTNDRPSSSVFNVIHSLDTSEQSDSNKQEENPSSEKHAPSTTTIACNPLLLTLPSYEQSNANVSNIENCNTSSTSNSLNEGGFNSSMHINRIFDDTHDHVNIFLFYLKNEILKYLIYPSDHLFN
jgi:hypothetical protein